MAHLPPFQMACDIIRSLISLKNRWILFISIQSVYDPHKNFILLFLMKNTSEPGEIWTPQLLLSSWERLSRTQIFFSVGQECHNYPGLKHLNGVGHNFDQDLIWRVSARAEFKIILSQLDCQLPAVVMKTLDDFIWLLNLWTCNVAVTLQNDGGQVRRNFRSSKFSMIGVDFLTALAIKKPHFLYIWLL